MALFDLIARLRLDGTGFQAGMSRAERTVNSLANTVRGQLAAAFSVAALTAAVKKTIQFASSMTDLSEALGVNAETLQEFDFAARQTGATVDDFAKALKNLAQARREALGDSEGKQAKSFAAFGIDSATLRNTQDVGTLMQMLSRGMKAVATDANTIPLVLDLIGTKSFEIIPALTAGLDDAAASARQLGLVMNNEVIERLDELGDEVEIFKTRFTVGLGPTIARIVKQAGEDLKFQMAFWTGAAASWKAGSYESKKSAGAAFDEAFIDSYIKADIAAADAKNLRAASRAARAGLVLPDFEESVKRSREGGGGRSLGGLSISSDPLTAVGNFLGSSGDSSAAYRHQAIVSKLDGILRAVEEANRRPGIF